MDFRERSIGSIETVMKYEELTSDELYDIFKLEYPYIIDFIDSNLGATKLGTMGIVRLLMYYVVQVSDDGNTIEEIYEFFNIKETKKHRNHIGQLVYARMYDWIVNNEELLQLRLL